MRTLIFSALALLLSYIAFYQNVEAADGDVYNFYFQKAPGPQTVIQGNAPPEKSLAVKETASGTEVQKPAANSSTSIKTDENRDPEFYKWAVRAGRGTRYLIAETSYFLDTPVDVGFMGTSIGGSYSINKYVAWDLELLFPEKQTTYYWRNGQQVESNRPSIVPYVAVQITPVSLTVFSYDLMDFSFLIGIAPTPFIGSSALHTFGGFRYAINFSKKFAFEARVRSAGSDISEMSTNLTWRF